MTRRSEPGLGHNRPPKGGRVYAIVFDLDTETLEKLYGSAAWRNAYSDIRDFLTARHFQWMQGSTYFGDDSIDAVKTVTTVQALARRFPWFKPAVRDIRMLRIEENNDLAEALELV